MGNEMTWYQLILIAIGTIAAFWLICGFYLTVYVFPAPEEWRWKAFAKDIVILPLLRLTAFLTKLFFGEKL